MRFAFPPYGPLATLARAVKKCLKGMPLGIVLPGFNTENVPLFVAKLFLRSKGKKTFLKVNLQYPGIKKPQNFSCHDRFIHNEYESATV
jgi:hypothetical protein